MRYDKIKSSSHRHTLEFKRTDVPFRCDGCKEDGIGRCYRCDECNFDLHFHCAIRDKMISPPFFPKCSFQFMRRPPKGPSRICDVCKKDVTGFVYHCQACGFDLHPCCAKLPMVWDNGEVKFYLYEKVSTSCHKCEKEGRSWSYRSSCKMYTLHVACVREMLVESWSDKCVALGKGSGGGGGTTKGLPTGVPCLKDKVQTLHKRSKSKKKKWCEMALLALRLVISAVLGDPTTLIANVVVSLMSRG